MRNFDKTAAERGEPIFRVSADGNTLTPAVFLGITVDHRIVAQVRGSEFVSVLPAHWFVMGAAQ